MRNSKNVFVFLFSLFTASSEAITNVSGGIYSNTTWTFANSPYIITDTVVVFPGITLTIEPGVIVKFMNNKRLDIRQGSLIATGNSTDSITFTSSAASPTIGIYSGINIQNGFTAFDYCNFYFADHSIYQNTGEIKHSNFQFNNICLYGLDPYSIIENCLFQFNNTAVGGADPGHFRSCTFKHNQNGVLSSSWMTMEYCIVDSNTLIGIETNVQDTIRYCEIKNNGTGLRIISGGGGQPIVIHSNQIEGNSIGIELINLVTNTFVYCNKICNNVLYDVKSLTTQNLNILENNYWCTIDSAIISSHIYDGYDDASLGLLDFIPIDTTSCYLNGCGISLAVSVTNATCDTCHSGSASLTIAYGFHPYTYTWYTTPIQTGSIAGGLSSGTYSVCVTDANGCTACTSFYIDSTNCNGFSVHANSINSSCSSCYDGMTFANITGGIPPYNFTWYTNPIQTSDTAVGLPVGTYSVCVTDLYGCSACDTTILSTGNCSAHFNLYPDTVLHQYIAVNMTSGVSPFSYSWNWGDSAMNDTTAFPTHTYANAGFYNICLTITDSVGCTKTYCNSFYLFRNNSANSMIRIIVRPPTITGISKRNEPDNILVFPNPASGFFIVKNIPPNSHPNLQIENLLGEKILEIRNIQNERIVNYQLLPGVYLITIFDDAMKITKKLILQ